MKKLQIITEEYYSNETPNNDLVDINKFSNIISPDCYEINVFDLTSPIIWRTDSFGKATTYEEEFSSILKMIKNSSKTICVFLLPQNIHYYEKSINKGLLKDLKNILTTTLGLIVPAQLFLDYENCITRINGFEYQSAFYFNNSTDYKALSKSEDSNKITSIFINGYYVTTLNILKDKNINKLFNYLSYINLLNKNNDIPKWVDNVIFNDDVKQKEVISGARNIIDEQNKIIENANTKLKDNLKYKSILYASGDELVSVVFDILQKMLSVNLSDFIDKKKEDFKFELNNNVFIGEIKGVSSNIELKYISQVEQHRINYIDENNLTSDKDIKKILIINYQRNRDIIERDKINPDAIKYANNTMTLIIDSLNLLKLFDLFLNNKISQEKIINYISKKVGLIDLNDLI